MILTRYAIRFRVSVFVLIVILDYILTRLLLR